MKCTLNINPRILREVSSADISWLLLSMWDFPKDLTNKNLINTISNGIPCFLLVEVIVLSLFPKTEGVVLAEKRRTASVALDSFQRQQEKSARQCCYDEIADLGVIQWHLELHLLLLKTGKWKFEVSPPATFLRQRIGVQGGLLVKRPIKK